MPEANFNPYAAPKADLSPPSGPEDRRGSPRRVPFWSGLRWLARACGLVVRRPLSWLGALLLVEALTVAGSLLLPRLADAGWYSAPLYDKETDQISNPAGRDDGAAGRW